MFLKFLYMPYLVVLLNFIFFSYESLASTFPDLPEPVSNNAVAYVEKDNQQYLISFMGLGKGKAYQDVHNKVWALNVSAKLDTVNWQAKTSVPSSLILKGRLAGIAVGVKDKAYLFGGYTVDEKHNEISSPDSFVYDVFNDSYQLLAPMPVPVDDAVALIYQQRYIYLISGWHNDGNVNLVQLYDVKTNKWQQASPFLGVSVFGHAGGIVNRNMLVCDGVKVQAQLNKRRTFVAEPACYSGSIDQDDPLKIDWQKIAHPTGTARYRMAVASDNQSQRIFFWGGSNNPYNFNGMGYNGKPSEPSNQLWTFFWQTQKWQVTSKLAATMDHRSAILLNSLDLGVANKKRLVIIGGMGIKQKTLSQVTSITVE